VGGRAPHSVAATRAGPPARNQCDVRGLTDLRVRGPVDEPCDVPASAVCEARLLGDHQRGLADGERGCPRTLPRHVWLGPADPRPRIVLGGGGTVAIAPITGSKGAMSSGTIVGATSRHIAAPNASTRLTPPADTSGVRNPRNAATACAHGTPGFKSNSEK
jgi:hypothetical protein